MRTLQPSMMPMTAHRSLRVSAERGETEEELEFLRSHLCNEVQGYSSYLPISEFHNRRFR
ncbi:hypothetical protein EXW96_15850 [Paenibacillus sp. JMULE4]|nr:hypothetical protein [Paenibacillus sp. JMULE4]